MASLSPEIKEYIKQEVETAVKAALSTEALGSLKLSLQKQVMETVPTQVESAMKKQVVEHFKEEEAGDYAEARRGLVTHNRLIADSSSNLKKVPFVVDQGVPPIYSLTPLVSAETVYSISEDEIRAYCKGYAIPPSGDLDTDRAAINEAIGAIKPSAPPSAPSTPA